MKKIENIGTQQLGNNWPDLFPQTKKSYYTQISNSLIEELIYGKDVGSGTFGKNNVQMIIIGGTLKLKEEGKNPKNKNIYVIEGYTEAFINKEIPQGDYTPILKAEYNNRNNAYGFKKCKVHVVTEKQKGAAENISPAISNKSSIDLKPPVKKIKIEKIQIPEDKVRVLQSQGETRIFVKKDWVFGGGLSKEISKYINTAQEKEKSIKKYQSYFDIDSKSLNKPILIPKIGEFVYLKPEYENRFIIPDKEIKIDISSN